MFGQKGTPAFHSDKGWCARTERPTGLAAVAYLPPAKGIEGDGAPLGTACAAPQARRPSACPTTLCPQIG